MSVLIRGMKMPKQCKQCRFCGFGGYDMELLVCSLTGHSTERLSDKRMEECPLVDVPTPHGRLIDGDELFNRDMQIYYGNTPVGTRSYIFKSDVAEMPTVIPPEVDA